MPTFKYNLGERVSLVESEEQGEVIARAEYATMENQYYLRYRAGDGRQVTSWWGESDIRG